MGETMALKDRFEKIISYFDTDDVSDVEETVEDEVVRPQPKPTVPRPAVSTPSQPQQKQRERQPYATAPYHEGTSAQKEMVNAMAERREALASQQEQITIALKYPRKYEDAQEIVDLLIVNECVLIDFQYMLDAQARRCLDFIDGASRVLYGSLQKVGSSMYLLTPANVVVDIEEMNIPKTNPESGFDFDMKRR